MDSISYSTYTSSRDISQVRVNFARPLCFCGFTAVSIYPEPPSTTGRWSRSAPPPPPPSPAVKKTNWVYECHFSSKQRGMMAPDPCEDCERRRTARSRLLAKNTKERRWFAGSNSGKGCERHQAVKNDEVELWPRKKPAAATTAATTAATIAAKHDHHTDHTTTTSAAHKTVVGADIQVEAKYLNAASMNGYKVCGFHMHALEWHHMQTLDVNQILTVAKDTSCDYFHLSVVRCLDDLAKTTTIKNCNIDTNYHLGLKLFRKVRCFCGKDAILVRGPAVASSTSSSQSNTTNSNRGNNDNSNNCNNNDSEEYFIMCAGRVYDNHTDYEMVPQSGMDAYYNYNIRTWIKSKGFINCSLQVRLQKAIFEFNLLPIHSRIYVTDWLSQWFKPITLAPPTQALTVFPSESVWFQRTDELLTTIRDPTTASSSSKVGAPALPVPLIPATLRPTLASKRLATVQDIGPGGLMVLSTEVQVKERDQLNSATGLYELDKGLKEALAHHAAVVKSIKERTSVLLSRSEEQYQYRKEMDMTDYPSVAMLLCNKCKNSTSRDFCVISRARPSSPFPPPPSQHKHKLGQGDTTTTSSQTVPTTLRSIHLPSPKGSDDEHVDAPGAQMDELFDLLDPLTGLIAPNSELDQADRELEQTMTRHAMVFERTMEVWSRLVPDFIQCRGCCFREAGLDVLPATIIFCVLSVLTRSNSTSCLMACVAKR
ncbi:hypothetical protein KI688_011081 [Linnemannia hyalina]|uniref:Uncharacterized protein n=1 Tax=Linnemannia hyalina TaxID=64524 RepID=A0A9P7XWZ5_9FUNG|nr:hypothetical protein KI688_011081 [Linnemannia hyalina]